MMCVVQTKKKPRDCRAFFWPSGLTLPLVTEGGFV